MEHVLEKLNTFISGLGRHECVIVLGDLNAQLPRSVSGLTGKWTWSIDGDKANAPKVLEFMRKFRLVAANSLFQPRRDHSVTTWHRPSDNAIRLADAAEYPKGGNRRTRPKQLDYILCSSRWKSSLLSAKVSWTPAVHLHGRKWDHALVAVRWRWRVRSYKPPIQSKAQ